MKNNNEKIEAMKMYRQNPQKGFELIYKEFSWPLFRYLRDSFNLSREEAEDLLQTIFLPWVKNPDKYIKAPFECPNKGKYQAKRVSETGYEVSCSCGANAETPVVKEAPVPAPDKSKLTRRAIEYRDSGKFENDRKELLDYFDKVLALDPMRKAFLAELDSIENDYKNKKNPLIDAIAPNFKKCFVKQIEMQNEIDELIR